MIRSQSSMVKQDGVSIIIVLFLLVVVSGLVISVTRLTGTQHINAMYSHRGAQAYFAASAGLGYVVARITGGNGCAIDSPQNISGYTVTMTCSQGPIINEGNVAEAYRIYTVTAIANAGSLTLPDVTNRRVRATVRYP